MKIYGIVRGESYEGSSLDDTLYRRLDDAQKELHMIVMKANTEKEELQADPLKEVKPDVWFDGFESIEIETYELI